MTVVGWIDTAEAAALWPDAPKAGTTLALYLQAGYDALVGFAPALPVTDPPTDPPANYKLAQVLHCRALWQAARREGDVIGFEDGGGIRARPIEGSVVALLRPPTPASGLVG